MRDSGLLLALALLSLALAATGAAAGPEEIANETLDDSQGLVDDVVGGIGDAAHDVGDQVQDTGAGIGDKAQSVGAAFGRAVRAVGHAAQAAAQGISQAGAALAAGAASAVAATGDALGAGLVATGAIGAVAVAALVSGLATGATLVGAALRDAGLAYFDVVSVLRPDAMPEPVFAGLAATGAAAGAGAGFWGLVDLLRRVGLAPLGLAGFSRIQDDELLNHPLRAQVFQVIQGNPGIHASALGRSLNVGWGTIVHHLEKLEKGGLVTTRKVNNQKCFFEVGGRVSRNDMAVLSAVKGDTTGPIAQFVSSHPMTSQKQLAEALDISPALASFHVKKLVNLGVLDRVRRGKETLLTTTDSLRRVMSAPAATPAVMAAPGATA